MAGKHVPSRVVRYVVLWPSILLILFFFLFPFYWQTITAFKAPADVVAQPVLWMPSHLYLGNFQSIVRAPTFIRTVVNSVVVSGMTTVVALVLGVCAAYALAKLPMPRKRSILILTVIAATFPAVALVPSLYLFLRQLRLLNTYVALIVPDTAVALPFTIWVLTNSFRDVPTYLVEQAEVDGCAPWQALVRVVLPLAAPGLLAAGLLVFITVWNEFLFAVTFTFTADAAMVPVFVVQFAGGWGRLAAASELVTLPIIVLAIICQRGIIRGLTAGALKG